MNDFVFYFTLGWEHILSFEAADHLLFLCALAAIYLVKDWKQVLILITAFTIGHSLTLALSAYDIIRFPANWVEFLIPLTIILTAVINVIGQSRSTQRWIQYSLALFFGLIHGMGFANTIRFMLSKKESIVVPLFSFNIGLEAGQLLVVFCILIASYFFVNKMKQPKKYWTLSLSLIAFVVGLYFCLQRLP